MRRTIDIAVIAIATGLLQFHGVAFWTSATGPAIGWAWSIGIEAAALWLWYHGGAARVAATLASALLIAGPFYQISAPLFDGLHQANRQSLLIEQVQSEVTQLENSLVRYDSNSAERIGWSARIDRTQEALDAARDRLRALTNNHHQADWRTYAVAGLQASVLLVVMLTQILAVSSLRRRNETPAPTETPRKGKSKQPETPVESRGSALDDLVEAVAKSIRAKLPEFDGKQRALAGHYGFRPADISLVLNHAERKRQGKETVAETALQRMAAGLGVGVAG